MAAEHNSQNALIKSSILKLGDNNIGRLQKELMDLMMQADKGISAFPDGENLYKWVATINGPEGTVYEGQMYKLNLEFNSNYPYKPPSVKFAGKCYHPNVDTHGNICLDILKEKWSALYTVKSILLSIRSLLAEPNNDSPLNGSAAKLWSDQDLFKKEMQKYQNTDETDQEQVQ